MVKPRLTFKITKGVEEMMWVCLLHMVNEAVRAAGNPVHKHTPFCQMWLEEHQNCSGCESELGCRKAHNLILLIIALNAKLDDSRATETELQNLSKYIRELGKNVIACNTTEGLEKVEPLISQVTGHK